MRLRRLTNVWGLCPRELWTTARFDPPALNVGRLQYVNGPVIPGISKRLNQDRRWAVSYDASSKWLCIGSSSIQGEMVALAPGAVATLKDVEITALWLHPDARG
jgi:hypothetical protein